MLDTVKLRVRVSAEKAAIIEQALHRVSRVELSTGNVLYELTSGSLEGSYDHRVSIRLDRVLTPGEPDLSVWEFMQDRPEYGPHLPPNMGAVVAYDLTVEGSVHKAMLGHNVEGGPVEPVPACRWFVANLAERLNVTLPDGLLWTVCRLDWAEVYRLPSLAISQFFRGLSRCKYPRRKVVCYGEQGISARGTTSGVKAYHKGPEFRAHDRPRLRDAGLSLDELIRLETVALGLIRFEVEIKPKTLKEALGGEPLVKNITRGFCEGFHDTEIYRLMKEAETGLEVVRTAVEVKDRLLGRYAGKLARTLFGTWMELSAFGEFAVLAGGLSKSTWYRQRSQLIEAGISWLGTDVHIEEPNLLPVFSPVRSSGLRLREVAAAVQMNCEQYAA